MKKLLILLIICLGTSYPNGFTGNPLPEITE